MGLFWLFLMWLAWGLWAFLDKRAGDTVGIPFAVLVGIIIALPVDIYYLTQIPKTGSLPAWRDIALAAAASLCGMVGSLAYLYACKYYNGFVVVSVQALYPLLSVLLFCLVLKEAPSAKQWFGIVMAVVGSLILLTDKSALR